MLVLALYGAAVSVLAVYIFVDRRPVVLSIAAMSLAPAIFLLAGIQMTRIIDVPATPTASLGMRLYLVVVATALPRRRCHGLRRIRGRRRSGCLQQA